MVKQAAMVDLTTEEREKLATYLAGWCNEVNLFISCADDVPPDRMEEAHSDLARAEEDLEYIQDEALPVSAYRLGRMLDQIGRIPRIAFVDAPAAMGFYERMRGKCRLARAKAKAGTAA